MTEQQNKKLDELQDKFKNEKPNSEEVMTFAYGVLSSNAYQRLDDSKLVELVITDTIPTIHKSSKVKEISVANLFANTISSGLSNQSISDSFIC